MKKATALLLFGLFTAFTVFAQEFPKNETNQIRIDPFQLLTINANEFCWAYDVVYDKKGNTISTGYLRGYVNDTSVHLNSEECGYFCSDKLYLAKQDSKGNTTWINSAIGNVRPTAVRINQHGEICLAGSFYGKLPVFLGTHYTQATDSSAGKIDQGFFITKYKSTGEIIACKIIPGKELFAFELDDDGNFYLGGCDEFRTSKEWSLSRRKMKLQRINKNFTADFCLIGDTLGDSHISSLSLFKNKVLAMITYSDTLKTNYFKLETNYMQHGALLSLYTNGDFNFFEDSILNQLIDPGIAVFDEHENIYLATGGYNHPQNIYALKPNGEVSWHMPIVKPSSNFITKILPYKNTIYMCGYGYGALFGVNTSKQLYAYKAKSSTDFFIAAFTPKGEIKWLKAGGEQATEYCQSIAIYQNHVAAFGFVTMGGNVLFKDTGFKAQSTLWLAKFKLNNLEKMNIWEPNPIKIEEPLYTVNETDCNCQIRADGKERYFMPSAGTFLSEANFVKYIGWNFDSSYQLEKNAFLYNFYAQPSFGDSYYSFSLYTVKPLRIVHPQKLYTLNLTPCNASAKWNSIPASINVSQGMREYQASFEADEFDSSSHAVYSILRNVNETNGAAIFNRALEEGDGFFDYNTWIDKINKKYHLNVSKKHQMISDLINEVLLKLEQKNIDEDEFILNEFVRTSNKSHQITEQEWANMCNLFEHNFNRNISELYSFLYPNINASFEPHFISTEISSQVLCAWNEITHQPITVNNQLKPSIILAKCNNLIFKSGQGTSANFTKWYHSRCNISNTHTLLKIIDAKYVDSETERSQIRQHFYSDFFIDKTKEPHKIYIDGIDYKPNFYSNDFIEFSGLYSNNAFIWININKQFIKCKVEGLIVNNNFIAATIEIAAQKLPNNEFQFSNNNAVLTINEDELMKQLNNLGFDKFLYQYADGVLKISLIKRSRI